MTNDTTIAPHIPKPPPPPTATEATQVIFGWLAAPFDPDELEWRWQSVGKGNPGGMMLPYVQGRAIMDRLDAAVRDQGGNWTDEVRCEKDGKGGGRSWICSLTVEMPDGRFIRHEDGADETDIEPTKGGISDALKRVAVKFGIGRYLYFMPRVYLDAKPSGSQWRSMLKSNRLPNGQEIVPSWALPGGHGRPPTGRGSSSGSFDDSEPEAQSAPSQRPQPASRQEAPPPPAQPPTHAPVAEDPEDPNVPLPKTPPPFNLHEVIKFGKFKGVKWGTIACGSPGGRRRSWLVWLCEQQFDKQFMREAQVSAKLLLQWLEGRAEFPAEDPFEDQKPAGGYTEASDESPF